MKEAAVASGDNEMVVDDAMLSERHCLLNAVSKSEELEDVPEKYLSGHPKKLLLNGGATSVGGPPSLFARRTVLLLLSMLLLIPLREGRTSAYEAPPPGGGNNKGFSRKPALVNNRDLPRLLDWGLGAFRDRLEGRDNCPEDSSVGWHVSLGNSALGQFKNEAAERQFRAALRIANTTVDTSTKDGAKLMAGIYDGLAIATYYPRGYQNDPNPEPAISMYRKALDILREANLDENNDQVGNIYGNMANALKSLHEWDEALDMYKKSMEILKGTHGGDLESLLLVCGNLENMLEGMEPNNLSVADAYNTLGTVHLEDLWDKRAAMRYFQDSLAIRRSVLGESHPSLAGLHLGIGNLLRDEGKHGGARRCYETALRIANSTGEDGADLMARIRNCLAVVANTTADASSEDRKDLLIAQNLNAKAILCEDRRDKRVAMECLQDCLAIRRRVLGENHRSVAGAHANIGNILVDEGNYRGAQRRFETALEIAKATVDASSEDGAMLMANIYNNLGLVYLEDRRDTNSAMKYFQDGLAIQRNVLGDNHPSLATSHLNIGNILRDEGKYGGAERHYKTALRIAKAMVNANTTVDASVRDGANLIANIYNNLAIAAYHQHNEEPAIRMYQKALDILREESPGEERSLVGDIYGNMASALKNLHKWNEASDMCKKAITILKGTVGAHHPKTQNVYSSLEEMLKNMDPNLSLAGEYNMLGIEYLESLGDTRAAMRCFQDSLAIKRSIMGENHPSLATAHLNIGNVLRDEGYFGGAQQCYETALQIANATFDTSSEDDIYRMANYYNCLAIVTYYQHNLKPALQMYQKALDIIREANLDENHLLVGQIYGNMANALVTLHKWDEAKIMYKKAIQILKGTVGEDHPKTQLAYKNLQAMLEDMPCSKAK